MLGIVATVVGVSIGLAIGILAALRARTQVRHRSTTGAFIGISIPPFVSAVLLQLIFAVYLTKWLVLSKPFLPRRGCTRRATRVSIPCCGLKHLILPVTVVAIQIIAVYSRYMRASLLEVNSDYMRTAGRRASASGGHRQARLRNALIPIVTVAAIDIGAIIGGLIITERIFEYPGMGDFFLDGLRER